MEFFDFFTKPSKPMLGMDISSSAVKLIELSKTGDKLNVNAFHGLLARLSLELEYLRNKQLKETVKMGLHNVAKAIWRRGNRAP